MTDFDFDRVSDILVCPLSHAKLVRQGQKLISTDSKTRLSYDIQDGIPRLLVDEATELPVDEWEKVMAELESPAN